MRKKKVEPIIDGDFLEFANAEKSDAVELMLKSHSRKNILKLMKALKQNGFEFKTNGALYPDETTGKVMLWLKNVQYIEPGEVVDETAGLENIGDYDDSET